ncbi:hypothetical protein HDE_05810 [Halotydeus destructor]|nr:hypothetical protein HDE_05810 [Halotydeus destructor]
MFRAIMLLALAGQILMVSLPSSTASGQSSSRSNTDLIDSVVSSVQRTWPNFRHKESDEKAAADEQLNASDDTIESAESLQPNQRQQQVLRDTHRQLAASGNFMRFARKGSSPTGAGGGDAGGHQRPLVAAADTSAPLSPASRAARSGVRLYDVPQIECPPAEDGMERFACPSPDPIGRYRCIEDHALCDGFVDCPNGADEDRMSCMFYKTTKAHLDVLADALLRWARGRY